MKRIPKKIMIGVAILVVVILVWNPFGVTTAAKSVFGEMSLLAMICPGGYQWQVCDQWETKQVCDDSYVGTAWPCNSASITKTVLCGSCGSKWCVTKSTGCADADFYVVKYSTLIVYKSDVRGANLNSVMSACKSAHPLESCYSTKTGSGTADAVYCRTCTNTTSCVDWVTKTSSTKPSGSVKGLTCIGGEVESCGNGICESAYSETPSNCPADCKIVNNDCVNPTGKEGDSRDTSYTCSDGTTTIASTAQCINGKWATVETKQVCPTCENLWWYDSTHAYCQQKEFCGTYMYQGLFTFKTKAECESSLYENPPDDDTIRLCQDVVVDDGDVCTEDLCTAVDGKAVVSHTVILDCGIADMLIYYQTAIIVTAGGLMVMLMLVLYGLKKK